MPTLNDSGTKKPKPKPLPSAGSKQKGSTSGAAIGSTTTTGTGTPKNEALSTGTYGSSSPEQAPNQVKWGNGTGSSSGGGGGGKKTTGSTQSWTDTHGTWADRNPGTWAERHDIRKTSGGGGGGGTGGGRAGSTRYDTPFASGTRFNPRPGVDADFYDADHLANEIDGAGGGGGGGTGSPFAPGLSETVRSLGLKSSSLEGKSVEETISRGARKTKKTGQKRSL